MAAEESHSSKKTVNFENNIFYKWHFFSFFVLMRNILFSKFLDFVSKSNMTNYNNHYSSSKSISETSRNVSKEKKMPPQTSMGQTAVAAAATTAATTTAAGAAAAATTTTTAASATNNSSSTEVSFRGLKDEIFTRKLNGDSVRQEKFHRWNFLRLFLI
jgi:hypothetical protein